MSISIQFYSKENLPLGHLIQKVVFKERVVLFTSRFYVKVI